MPDVTTERAFVGRVADCGPVQGDSRAGFDDPSAEGFRQRRQRKYASRQDLGSHRTEGPSIKSGTLLAYSAGDRHEKGSRDAFATP